MRASYLLECENWEESLSGFEVARRFTRAAGRVGTMDQKELFAERVAEIDPSMGFCKFNIGIMANSSGGAAMSAKDRERALREMKGSANASGSLDLQAKIDAVLAETRRQQADPRRTACLGWALSCPCVARLCRKAIVKVHDAVFGFEEGAKEAKAAKRSDGNNADSKTSERASISRSAAADSAREEAFWRSCPRLMMQARRCARP